MSDSDRESMSSRGSQEGLTRDHAADTAAIAAAGADAGVGEDDAYQSMRGMDQSGAGFADTLERDGGADDSQAGLAPGAADASAVVRSAEPAAALHLLRIWHAACSRSRDLEVFLTCACLFAVASIRRRCKTRWTSSGACGGSAVSRSLLRA